MNAETYIVYASPGVTQYKTKTSALTGTTNVTFDLRGLSAYDTGIVNYRLNKVIVNFDDEKELIFDRPTSNTDFTSLSSTTFKHVLNTDFIDQQKRNIYFSLQREDSQIDTVHVTFTMHKPPASIYEDVNLIKTDYFDNEQNDEKLLLTFINKNPEVLGLSLLDLKTSLSETYNPDISGGAPNAVASNKLNIGFTQNYVLVDSAKSNTGAKIMIELNPQTGMPKTHGNVTLKFRTRGNPASVGSNAISIPGDSDSLFIPLSANSGYFQLSGYLNWNCGDLLKDYYLSKQVISIPLMDITGTRATLHDYNYYFTNVNVGLGASSTHGVLSGGYFMVDLYDVVGCDNVSTKISTLTAYVNYDVRNPGNLL